MVIQDDYPLHPLAHLLEPFWEVIHYQFSQNYWNQPDEGYLQVLLWQELLHVRYRKKLEQHFYLQTFSHRQDRACAGSNLLYFQGHNFHRIPKNRPNFFNHIEHSNNFQRLLRNLTSFKGHDRLLLLQGQTSRGVHYLLVLENSLYFWDLPRL